MAGRGRGRDSTLPAWMTQGMRLQAQGDCTRLLTVSDTVTISGAGGAGPNAPGSIPNPGQPVSTSARNANKLLMDSPDNLSFCRVLCPHKPGQEACLAMHRPLA